MPVRVSKIFSPGKIEPLIQILSTNRSNFLLPVNITITLALLIFATPSLYGESKISFNRDIRPILSDKCYYCHGPDTENNKGDLRLDSRDAAIEAGAIVPGDIDKSELIYRITTDDTVDLMPPRKSHKGLSSEEIDLLSQWVSEGAPYEGHWSYQKVMPTSYLDIDSIVEQGLQAKNLTLSPEADRQTLIRRAYLDTLGLPPTIEQLQKHLSDDHNDESYGALIDQLLASPHYAENMATYWLDAVRFADSTGYHGDLTRDASPFRDYVIHAFDTNKPYDQFIIEQIAGDLLPEATLQQRIASGYNRLNQISKEGGIQDKEYIKKYQAERVRTTATTMLGSTLACAECHDHKFDPFTAKDFYSFAAFFSDILEKGAWNKDGDYQETNIKKYLSAKDIYEHKDFGPTLKIPNNTFHQPTEKEKLELSNRLEVLKQGSNLSEMEFNQWLENKKLLSDNNISPYYNYEIPPNSFKVEIPDTQKPLKNLHKFIFEVKLKPNQTHEKKSLGIRFGFSDKSKLFYWGRSLDQFLGDENITRISSSPNLKDWKTLEIPISKITSKNQHSLEYIEIANFGDTEKEPLQYEFKNLRFETIRYQTPLGHLNKSSQLKLEQYLLNKNDTQALNFLREQFYLKHASNEPHNTKRASYLSLKEYLYGERQSPATVSAKPREIKILPRGNWMDESGEVVLPATPSFLDHKVGSTNTNSPLTRVDLAQWMVHRDNPLVARTFVNRLWAQYFGTALSSAPEDLGLQGEYPVYPELLDFLALEFIDSGWDIKHIVKLILTSKTYRQTSASTPQLDELDPYNRLLARQTPRRLQAETIRDNALSISGLLVPRIGGRSVSPSQPKGYYANLNFPKRTYHQDKGENLYRRGIYTHWQRTFLHPMMLAFDAPNRDECAVSRPISNTPLQALNLLNDPTFVDAAIALGTQLLKNESHNDEQRIRRAYQKVLARYPNAKETSVLLKFLDRERIRFRKNPKSIEQFLGSRTPKNSNSNKQAELAAWSSVSRALLNLHETITRY